MSWDDMSETKQHPALETLIVTRTRDLGDGFEVRRALPSAQRRMVGPFIFFDQMGPAVLRARATGSTCGRIRTSGSPPSPISSTARSSTATASARAADPARRGQLDDRGARHRPLRAHARPRCAPAGGRLFGIQTWVALPRSARGDARPPSSTIAADALPVARGRGRAPAADRGRALRRALARADVLGDVLRGRGAGGRRAPRAARPSTRSARSIVVEGAVEIATAIASSPGELLVLPRRAGRSRSGARRRRG